MLFDEPTSALDPETETKIMKNIYRLGMTMILIAHRLDTIRDCNQIYVIEQGRITQHGTHDELSRMDGLYSNLLKYA
jgi:ABC-type multidrug transport system fused ATPase/permease subunit